ncbi:hypothetical protein [Kitasatospora sp. NPDC059160]|uniref:hypothetical protein n=1 Tax=Kitasatospora sp. NPDC059160 TaxID=3346748 RepID=UPI0036C1FDAA
MTAATRCPRCGGTLEGSTARSRTTINRDRVICSPCGSDEAVRDQRGLAPIPPTDWPVRP